MKNLILLGERRRSAALGASSIGAKSGISGLCRIPSDDGSAEASCTILLTLDGILSRVGDEGEVVWISNLNKVCDENNGDWFDVTFVDPEIVCLSKSGAIVTASPSTGCVELVGKFDHGLEAGQWSPDREVLLLCTFVDDGNGGKSSVLLSMNGQWEVLAEMVTESHVSATESQDAGVFVAWRPDGTLFAVSTVDRSDGIRRIRIYAREDLALRSVGRSEDGSGKVVPNLQGHIAWAGGGCSNLLTSVQRKGKRTQQVVFFEPNGLRHREFPLRPDNPDAANPTHATVLGLAWNVESDLLAVTLREKDYDKVQLWHRSNYHWYLKQELRYSNQKILCVRFDGERSYLLFVALGLPSLDLEWREYDFCWDPSTVHVFVRPSASCVAVSIDGCLLNMTPFDRALVPPPMYASTLTMGRPIREIAFTPTKGSVVAAAVYLSDGSFVLLGGKGSKSHLIANFVPPSIQGQTNWAETKDIDVASLRQICIMKSTDQSLDLIALVPASVNEYCEVLVEIRLEWADDPGVLMAAIRNAIQLEGRVLRVVHWSDREGGALLELQDGALLEYDTDESGAGHVLPSAAEPLLEPCPWIAALHDASIFDERSDLHEKRLVVGRSMRSRLYCHDRLLVDSSSSFILAATHQFLSYVTADARCQLRFLPLNELYSFDPLMGSDENHLLEGYEARNVERGARLVAVLPMSPSAVLQMPRGNLESVFPRALVLQYAMSKIEGCEYEEAFIMMRRQKVDLNLIVDMNPSQFLDGGVNIFLEQVTVVDHLNLFISCLQNYNVTESLYNIPAWFQRGESTGREQVDFDFETKVNCVCRRVREILLQAENDGKTAGGRPVSQGHFLLPILSTFAKENPPKLEDALALIKQNALAVNPATSKKPPLFGETAQSSLHYLAFLADYQLLFDTALSMYDFDLARAVARNSQMDPKVYLPLLKRLRALPENYGRYEVDMRLQRYETALSNLVRSKESGEALDELLLPDEGTAIPFGNDFEHCMNLIESQELHRLGLELFEDDSDKRRSILVSLGENLVVKKHAKAALGIFLAADPPDYNGAKHAARLCGDWRSYFTLATAASPEEDHLSVENRKRSIASSLAEEISADQGNTGDRRTCLVDAARILLDYSQDVVGAVEMLVRAEMWSEGRRIAMLHSRQDLAKKCTDSAVSFAYASMEDFDSRTESFLTTNKRYMEVLKIRKASVRDKDVLASEAFDSNVDDSGSLFSLASDTSNTSVRSNMSGRSVGSATSVSSVISVGAQTSFTIKSEHDINKHKSKFNKIGREKKKKKKKPGRKRMQPGSEEELKSLVGTLKSNCADDDLVQVISGTIQYLCQVGKLQVARELYDAYTSMQKAFEKMRTERLETTRQEKKDAEQKARREGTGELYIIHPVEAEVDPLHCPNLPSFVQEMFSFL